MKRTATSESCQWTAADAAELDVLLHELIDCYFDHRDRCAHCLAWRERRPDSSPCPYLGSAIGIVLDWRQRRQLLTRAEELRLERRLEVEAA